ncbi:hypothetical protein KEM48_008803, partial [Puccinia striiformis f. sp. tritici PST-130]
MDGHAYTLEEINSLTAEQARWVEANPNFNDLPALHEDNMSEGELPFHEASQNDPLVSPLSGSSPENHNVGNPAPNPPLNTPSPIVAEKKPTHHMEVNSNETVRGEDSSQGFTVREYFAPGNHSSNPLRAPSNAFWPPANHLAPHQSRSPEQPLPNSTPTPVHLSFTRPNVADYGPLPPQVGIRCLAGKARRDFDSSVCTGADPRTWDTFADWLMKHKPDTSNTEVVANAYRRLCQMPNERAVDFYNRFRLWQLDAEAYDYSHHEQTGFVKRLEPHLRQRVQTAISTAVNLGHPMNFEQIAMCAIDDDRRHQNYRGMNGVSCAPPQASLQLISLVILVSNVLMGPEIRPVRRKPITQSEIVTTVGKVVTLALDAPNQNQTANSIDATSSRPSTPLDVVNTLSLPSDENKSTVVPASEPALCESRALIPLSVVLKDDLLGTGASDIPASDILRVDQLT